MNQMSTPHPGNTRQVDVIVVGSGCAGLTAAVTARKAGLDVMVAEKTDLIGGTTAYSGGVLWVPNNRHSKELQERSGIPDSPEKARAYLEDECGNYAERDRLEAYLKTAPEMVDFLEQETRVRFYGMDYPDYRSESTNCAIHRSIGTVDYEAKALGPEIRRIRNMLPQTLFMGLAVGSGVEMMKFMRAGSSLSSLGYVARKMMGHFVDLARYGQSQQLVRGRALIARLTHSLLDMGTRIETDTALQRLLVENGRVIGAEFQTPSGLTRVEAQRGVVLACGGFVHDTERFNREVPASVGHARHRSPVPVGNTGDGVRAAEEQAGAAFNSDVAQPAAWQPCSVVPGVSGEEGVWPHLLDRQKPGFFMVLQNGQRFVNESASYHDMIPHMVRACSEAGLPEAKAWMIGDGKAVKRWGIGRARPFPVPHGHLVRKGYLKKAHTLEELARQIGVDPAALKATVNRFNGLARAGKDEDFGRGGRIYDLYQGEDGHEPNPCLGPVENAPFYAVQIIASEIGTFAGLRTDPSARVLSEGGQPIPGLYAVGNDQASVFGGFYPGAGSTLGPAATFGYIAGRHLAEAPAALAS